MSEYPPLKSFKYENVIGECLDLDTVEQVCQEVHENDRGVGEEAHNSQLVEVGQEEKEVEIPSLVVEILLERIQNVKLLKTCRLVNKYWNGLACTPLQIYSFVHLDEWNIREFLKCLEPRSVEQLSLMPSPFKIVHISDAGDAVDEFIDLASRPNITITDLKLFDSPTRIQPLNTLLKLAMEELTQLNIESSRADLLQGIFQDIHLKALKSLIIDIRDRSSEGKTMDTLKMALENSVLKQLSIDSDFNLPIGLPLFTLNLSQVVELTLISSGHESDDFWNIMENLQLPSLRTLKLRGFIPQNLKQESQMYTFLSKAAVHLIKLRIYCPYKKPYWWRDLGGIIFPKLRDLSLIYLDDIFTFFTSERFPSLQKICLLEFSSNQMRFVPDGLNVLPGIRILQIEFFHRDEKSDVVTTHPNWMVNLAKQFPNIERLSVMRHRIPFTMLDLYRAYPNLKYLRVKADSDFMSLFGTSKKEVYRYINYMGKTVEDIFRRPSVFYFTELESLSLINYGESDNIHDYLFRYGLSRMTTLKFLEIYLED